MQFAQQVATCKRVIAAGNLQLAALIGQFVRSLIFHALIYLLLYIYFADAVVVAVFVPLQNDESHSVVLPAFIDSAQCHKARLYGTAGCGSGRRSSWSRGRWSGWRSSRWWCGLCQRISSGLPRCTGHTGAYFIHCQNASSFTLSRLFSPLCGLATDVAYFCDSFSCSHFHWPFPFFIANSVCGWL